MGSDDGLIKSLLEGSSELADLQDQFMRWLVRKDTQVFCFYETKPANYGGKVGLSMLGSGFAEVVCICVSPLETSTDGSGHRLSIDTTL